MWIKNGGMSSVAVETSIDNLLDRMMKDFFGEGK
jgi:hypothetical protein